MCTDLEDGNVRLVDGSSAYEGRVEICNNRQWGTICNRYWSANDAVVVCRQLGFSVAGNKKHSIIISLVMMPFYIIT